MSSLQLPPWVIQLMDKKRRAFLWSGEKTGKVSPASCLVAWTTFCAPKDLGGLGIKDLGTNFTPLRALWVNSRASVSSLRGDIHGEHWEVLRTLLPLYQAITSVQLEDGKSCSFWMDVWLGDDALAESFPALFSHCANKEITVYEVMASGLQQTMVQRLNRRATLELLQAQNLIAGVSLCHEPDRRVSPFINNYKGLDSSAVYSMLKARGQQKDERSIFVWQNSAPPRVQMFMWLLVQRRIQCRTVLFKKHAVQSTVCELCYAKDETPEHIIGGCVLGKLFWEKLNMPSISGLDVTTLHLVSPQGGVPRDEFSVFIALSCWQLWKARNAAVFRNEHQGVNQLLETCKCTAEQWRFRFKKKKKPIAEKWCQIFEMAIQR